LKTTSKASLVLLKARSRYLNRHSRRERKRSLING
jgi:hypothetical protein